MDNKKPDNIENIESAESTDRIEHHGHYSEAARAALLELLEDIINTAASDPSEISDISEVSEEAGVNAVQAQQPAPKTEPEKAPGEGAAAGIESETATGAKPDQAAGQKRKFKRTPTTRTLMLDMILVILIGLLIILADSPGKVTGLRAAETTYDSVTLTWSSTEKVAGYHIYRSEDGKDFDYIASATDTTYTDMGLTTGKPYSYSVTAFNSIKRQGPDKKKAVKVMPELDKPVVKGSVATGSIELDITPVSGAIGYEIYRNGEKISDQKETAFVDKKAKTDKDYKYEVKAYRYRKHPVYSVSSKPVNLKLIAAGHMEAEIVGDELLLSWDGNEKYAKYELYKGDELLDTISDTEYYMSEINTDEMYEMKLVGISEDESVRSPASAQAFVVDATTMTNQEARDAACEWGIAIADDNSFTYGTGKRAHRCGCYFCGTNVGPNKNIKGSSLVNGHSYEKTYCCNPFVHACYAHGAGDPGMLKVCQRGGSVGMSVKSYTRFGNWKKVGKPAKSKLQRGDVLVRSGHVSMYIGDGQIVQAIDKGWTDESIRYNNLSDKSYAKYEFVMRYTGNGGTKYEVRELSEEEIAEKEAEAKAAEEKAAEEKKAEDKEDTTEEKTPADNSTDA